MQSRREFAKFLFAGAAGALAAAVEPNDSCVI